MAVPLYDDTAAVSQIDCPHCGQAIILCRHAKPGLLMIDPRDLVRTIGILILALLTWASMWWLVGVGWWSAALLWSTWVH